MALGIRNVLCSPSLRHLLLPTEGAIGTSFERALEGVRVTNRAPSPVVALAMTKAAVASMVSGTMDEDYTRRHL
jgi:hypothetical protein